MSIRPETIEEIRSRASLVDLVSETVKLKQSGKNFLGLCPFHREKTPSFYVREEEGLFHCFGCGKKGSAFDLLMELKGFTFPEAVKYLAARTGVKIEESSGDSGAEREMRARKKILGLSVQATLAIVRKALTTPEGTDARNYLTSRKISDEIRDQFLLGYLPHTAEELVDMVEPVLHSHGATRAQTIDALRAVGLIKERDGRREFASSFHRRLIYPITRSDGVAVAFGGRIIHSEPDRPKYINSCESLLYSKRKTFYGLSQALSSFREQKQVYVVEGYMDVLAMVQLGFTNVVATCGTALTPDHAKLLSRFCDRVIVVFDGDDAGRKAAASCFQPFINTQTDVRALFLPDDVDPGSLIENYAVADARALIEQPAKPIVEVFVERLVKDAGGETENSSAAGSTVGSTVGSTGGPTVGSTVGSAVAGKVASRVANLVAEILNPVEREVITRQAAALLGVSFSAFESLVGARREVAPAPIYVESRPQLSQSPHQGGLPQREQAYSGGAYPARSARKNSSRVPTRIARDHPLTRYYRQLVVSVLCEPRLAATFITDVTSIISGDAAGEAPPENIVAFIGRMAEVMPLGVTDIVLENPNKGDGGNASGAPLSPESDLRLRELADLLTENELDARQFLKEALRQSNVGGGKPADVVKDLGRTAGRFSLQSQLEKLRQSEAAEDSVELMLERAQEKLQARRTLESIKSPKPTPTN